MSKTVTIKRQRTGANAASDLGLLQCRPCHNGGYKIGPRAVRLMYIWLTPCAGIVIADGFIEGEVI
jgi:hypothetical protein